MDATVANDPLVDHLRHELAKAQDSLAKTQDALAGERRAHQESCEKLRREKDQIRDEFVATVHDIEKKSRAFAESAARDLALLAAERDRFRFVLEAIADNVDETAPKGVVYLAKKALGRKVDGADLVVGGGG